VRLDIGVASRPQVLETWRDLEFGAARARLGEPARLLTSKKGERCHGTRPSSSRLRKKRDD
jgi:hypothetical protein